MGRYRAPESRRGLAFRNRPSAAYCALVVLLFTKAAARSRYVTYEWSFALGVGIRVIPVLLEAGAELHPRLEGIQRVVATSGKAPWTKVLGTSTPQWDENDGRKRRT